MHPFSLVLLCLLAFFDEVQLHVFFYAVYSGGSVSVYVRVLEDASLHCKPRFSTSDMGKKGQGALTHTEGAELNIR